MRVAEPGNGQQLPVLGFADPVFLPGHNTSVRRGLRWLKVEQVRVQLAEGRLSAPLQLHTRACRFDQLRDAELAFEHDPACRSVAGLLAVMQRHYPGFAPQEMVTVCDFWLDPAQSPLA